MKVAVRTISASTLLFLLMVPALSQTITGKVTGFEGNTAIIVTDEKNQSTNIKLQYVRLPDESHFLYKPASYYIVSLLSGKTVQVKLSLGSRDYGQVFFNGANVNLQLVAKGIGWYSPEGPQQPTPIENADFKVAQSSAKSRFLGVWGSPPSSMKLAGPLPAPAATPFNSFVPIEVRKIVEITSDFNRFRRKVVKIDARISVSDIYVGIFRMRSRRVYSFVLSDTTAAIAAYSDREQPFTNLRELLLSRTSNASAWGTFTITIHSKDSAGNVAATLDSYELR